MTHYTIYFKALSTITGIDTAEKWHLATKTSNTYDNYLSMEMVFKYYDITSQFDITGKRMTLFHMGTDSSTQGIAVVLSKGTNASDPIQVGLIASDGTLWKTISGTFYTLTNATTSSYYILLTYDYSGNIKNINFYVVEFNNPTTKTTPDFSFETTSGESIEPIGNQWGFGSAPQSITDSNGYLSTEGYNSYVAQNLEVSFLRTWNTNPTIPATSNTVGTYAMFNSVDSTHSLYNLNTTFTLVPDSAGDSTSGMNFQLYLTGTTLPTDIYNSASNPDTQVTPTTSTTNYPTLNPISSYDFAINYDTGSSTNPVNSYTVSQPSNINCLLEGTKILTSQGYKLIEDIKLDDLIITGDDRIVKILGIHTTTLFAKDDETIPYVVKKGQYGAIDDLYLSKHHCLLIDNDYYDVPYRIGLELSDIKYKVINYYHLETENYLYDTMIANGVIVETYTKIKDYSEVPNKYKNTNGLRIYIKK